jgi:choline dehydrogenase-like flavoprotein
MATKYELNDASVIVVVGSGAGGGTLANELCQKGHKVVCLEARSHLAPEDFVNDEFEMWSKLTWQDPRTGQPIWIVKAVGGSTNHWAALAIRLQDHEMKARTTYGAVAGANLQDWPFSLQELEPYYDKAESKMGVTGTNGITRQPDTNAFKVVNYCATKAGYAFEMGPSAINSVARDGRPACQMIGFLRVADVLRISPAPKGQIPAIARNSVDLPEPDGPERTTFSASASTKCFVSTAHPPSGRKRSTSSKSILGVPPTLATRFGPASLSASAWLMAASKEFRRSTTDLNPAR